jgi:hypothetical protein
MTDRLIDFLLKRGWRCVIWLSFACVVGTLICPAYTVAVKLLAILVLVATTPFAYGFFRLYLKALTSKDRGWLEAIPIWYTVAVMYIFAAAVPLLAVVLPFHLKEVPTDGISFALFMGGIPSGMGVAIAAAKTLDECRVIA